MEKSIQMRSVVMLFVVVCGIMLAARGATVFLSQNYNSAAEANGLLGVLELSEGRALYPDRQSRPYSVYLYPPVLPLVSSAVIKTLQVEETRHKVLVTRLLSFICFLGLFVLIFRELKASHSVSLSLFAILCMIGLSRVADYFTTSRNDCWALLVEFAAFTYFLKYIRLPRWQSLLIFSVLSIIAVWTRQNAVAVFASAILWLVIRKQWKVATTVAVTVTAIHGLILFYWMDATHGQVWEHLVLSNIRPFRPLNKEFFDPSLLSFFAAISLFVVASIKGLFSSWDSENEVGLFWLLCLGVSTLLAGSVFMRAGGDVNYFFLPIILALYFALPVVTQWLHEKWGAILVAGQLALVATVYGLKIYSNSVPSTLNYEMAANIVRDKTSKYVLLTGIYSQGLGINLRDWAYFGPDVINGSAVARNGHKNLRWIIHELDRAIETNQITAVVNANPKCHEFGKPKGRWFEPYHEIEKVNDWLCIYRKASPSALAQH